MDYKAETVNYKNLDITDKTILEREDNRRRRSSLMVEIINNQISPVDIQKMMEAGMNIAKFSTSYSTTGDRIRLLGVMDRAASVCSTKHSVFDWPVATSGMLKTCVVKTGILEKDVAYVTLTTGSQVVLTSNLIDFDKCSESLIFVDNSHMAIDMKVGLEVTLNEGDVIMICTEILDDKKIKCEIIKGGPLVSMSTLCVRGMKRSRPYMTNKDLQIITFCLQYQMDVIIIYYVRHVATIIKTKEFIGKKVKRPLIFGAICTQEGLENIDDVLRECDGIVLPREIITYELPKDKVNRLPAIQKWIAAKCQQAGKPLFISGGVLEELVMNGQLVGSDISDVTNALLDGVSGFILTKCHNIENTIEAIYTLNEICCSIEPINYHRNKFMRLFDAVRSPCNAAEAAVMACALVAVQTHAKMIILPTVSGHTARALVHFNPSCLVIAVSTDIRVARILAVYRETVPLVYKDAEQISLQRTIQKRVDFAIEYALFRRWVDAGDTYVTLSRSKDTSAYCDAVRIWTVLAQRKARVVCEDDGEAQ